MELTDFRFHTNSNVESYVLLWLTKYGKILAYRWKMSTLGLSSSSGGHCCGRIYARNIMRSRATVNLCRPPLFTFCSPTSLENHCFFLHFKTGSTVYTSIKEAVCNYSEGQHTNLKGSRKKYFHRVQGLLKWALTRAMYVTDFSRSESVFTCNIRRYPSVWTHRMV